MKYQKQMPLKATNLYQQIIDAYLSNFQFYNHDIKSLHPGTFIHRQFYTKIHREAVNGTMKVIRMKENEYLEIHIDYGQGELIQSYTLKSFDSSTQLTYEEENTFIQKRMQINYHLVSIFYKLIFNYQTRKRFKALERMSSHDTL